MEQVVIIVWRDGNIYRVFPDVEIAKTHLRKKGYHPHRDESHCRNWYEVSDRFVCSMWLWEVTQI